MGLTTSPRVFTKILKPVFASLRANGHLSLALGLTIHPIRSVLLPCKQIVFLGFILCSVTMTVQLTHERLSEFINLGQSILSKKSVTIRLFAKLIGKMVVAEPGVEAAPLFYKPLERLKTKI